MPQLTTRRSGSRPKPRASDAAAGRLDAAASLGSCPRIRVDDVVVDGDTLLSVTTRIGDHEWHGMSHIGDRTLFASTSYGRIAGIRDQLSGIADAGVRKAEGGRLLRELGIQLLRCLFDRETRSFLWIHRGELEGVVLESSGELDLPWEIVHLEPPEGIADDHEPHFLASSGLVRWVDGAHHPTELRVRRDRVRVICPDYTDPLRLPSLDDEAATLDDSFGSHAVRHAARRDVTAAVRSGFDLLHFGGHGVWSDAKPPLEELLLTEPGRDDSSRVAPPPAYTDADLRADLRRSKHRADAAAIVVLNACDLGRVPSGAAQPSGFARTFLAWGAGAFVGCSWPVGDSPAADFAEAFYGGLIGGGLTFREATIAARRCAADRGDVSELAYAVFAHPDARVVVV